MIFFVLWDAISVYYLTRDKVCNGESVSSISFVVFYCRILYKLKQYIFFTPIITVIKSSDGYKDNITT